MSTFHLRRTKGGAFRNRLVGAVLSFVTLFSARLTLTNTALALWLYKHNFFYLFYLLGHRLFFFHLFSL
jgi:hypothetical protein